MTAPAARLGAQPKRLLCTLIASVFALSACGGDDNGVAPSPTSGTGGGNSPATPFPPTHGGGAPNPANPEDPNQDQPPANPQQRDDVPEPDSLALLGEPPPAVRTDTTYDFLPKTYSPEGEESLTFNIANKPEWASFDNATGRLTGKPENGHLGAYTDIVITVSDGEETAELEFAIDVVQTASGAMSLSWEPPHERADGTPLSDLAGYKIYWGTVEGEFPNSVSVDNPSLSSFVLEQMTPAYYYVVATAVDSAGLESTFSNVVEAEIE